MGCGNSQVSTPGGSGNASGNGSKQRHTAVHQEGILRGNVSLECPSTARIVRIFTSSTFTDTRHERNALMETAYPALKELCQQHGYEFQVVDMRWGVRDEATDDHMTTELCLREVDLCKTLSTGPFFVTFLSHKYGYRDFPREIEATEFEKLITFMSEQEASLLKKWFQKDENSIPPKYALQPISSLLPDFRANDEALKKPAKMKWSEENAIMQTALAIAAQTGLGGKTDHTYSASVTETEIRKALSVEDGSHGRCVWFDRRIHDIDSQETSYLLSRYRECLGPEEKDRESRDRLSQLRDHTLPRGIPTDNIVSYKIKWNDNGIDPINVGEHRDYINQLCEDFQAKLSTMIISAIRNRRDSHLDSPVFEEVVHHARFCQEKCRAFQGRTHTLQEIQTYLTDARRQPLVLHGPSGCGKTSILATACTGSWTLLRGTANVVIRFIGTTPAASSVGSLLVSIIQQLGIVYNFETTDLPQNTKDLRKYFLSTLSRATPGAPLLLFLDSLDQLDQAGDSRQLGWIPKELPANVKMVVSTLPEEKYEILPRLKELFPESQVYVEVPSLDQTEVTSILDTWLVQANRRLTSVQRGVLYDAVNRCPLPLFLKLSFDQTLKWKSYWPADSTVLQENVRGCIDALLDRVEGLHGHIFVQRALGYLTLSRGGLSETELEDILSCDDDVLNDVYMYWTPPIRRLPPLLLVRLKTELGQYLVDRGADGVRVFFWYHRQFIEAATDRYCSDPKMSQIMHNNLAEFFSGVWANGNEKCHTDSTSESRSANRHVASQPVSFGTNYNRRKLNNLPYHRLRAAQDVLLGKECLCNLEFVSAKLKSEGLRQIMDDYLEATSHFPDNQGFKNVSEAIHLSQNALASSPGELPAQLLTRIKDKQGLEDFLAQCRACPDPFLLPDQLIVTQTGGPLIYSPADHTTEITALDLTSDGKVAVTCSLDETVKTWDVNTGQMLRSIENTGEDSVRVCVACGDASIVIVNKNYIRSYDIHSGVENYTMDQRMANSGFCVAGNDSMVMCVFLGKNIQMFTASNGGFLGTASNPHFQAEESMGRGSAIAGGVEHVAVSEEKDRNKLFLFHIADSKFLNHVIELPVSEAGMKDIICCVTFSADRKHVIIGAGQSCDIIFYDVNDGELVRTLPGKKHDRMSVFLNATNDGHFLISSNWNNVVIWDLQHSERHVVLQHLHRSIVNARTVDMRIFVTATNDPILRIWDISRQDDSSHRLGAPLAEQQQKKSDGSSGVRSDFVIKSLHTTDSPRFLLLHGSFQHKGVAKEYLRVYDVSTCSVVRQVKLQKSDQLIVPFGDRSALVGSWDRRMRVIDLVTLTFSKQLQGYLPKMASSPNDIRVIGTDKVVIPSKARLNVKIISLDTGRVLTVMKAGQTERISGLQMGKHTLLASTTKGPLLVFSLETQSFLFAISPAEVSVKNVLNARMTPDDTFLLYKLDSDSDSVDRRCVVVWNLKKRKEHCRLSPARPYQGDVINRFDLLGADSVVATGNGFISSYCISSGNLLYRQSSKQGNARVCSVSDSTYFVSYNNDVEDNTVKIWTTLRGKCVASFTPDIRPREIFLSKDGRTLIGYFQTTSMPVVWTLQGGNLTADAPQGNLDDSGISPYGNEYMEADLSNVSTRENDDSDDPDTDEDNAT